MTTCDIPLFIISRVIWSSLENDLLTDHSIKMSLNRKLLKGKIVQFYEALFTKEVMIDMMLSRGNEVSLLIAADGTVVS